MDQQSSDTKWIESTVTNEQKRDELPLCINSNTVNKPFLAELQVMENILSFEVDTGAAVSIMYFRYHFPNEPISNSTLQLKTYTKDQLPVIGEVKMPVSYNNQKEILCCT